MALPLLAIGAIASAFLQAGVQSNVGRASASAAAAGGYEPPDFQAKRRRRQSIEMGYGPNQPQQSSIMDSFLQWGVEKGGSLLSSALLNSSGYMRN